MGSSLPIRPASSHSSRMAAVREDSPFSIPPLGKTKRPSCFREETSQIRSAAGLSGEEGGRTWTGIETATSLGLIGRSTPMMSKGETGQVLAVVVEVMLRRKETRVEVDPAFKVCALTGVNLALGQTSCRQRIGISRRSHISPFMRKESSSSSRQQLRNCSSALTQQHDSVASLQVVAAVPGGSTVPTLTSTTRRVNLLVGHYVDGRCSSLVAEEPTGRLSSLATFIVTGSNILVGFQPAAVSGILPTADCICILGCSVFIHFKFGLLAVEAASTLRLDRSTPQAISQRVASRRRRWICSSSRFLVLLVQHSSPSSSQQSSRSRSRSSVCSLLPHRRVQNILLHPYPQSSGWRSDEQSDQYTHQRRGGSAAHRESA